MFWNRSITVCSGMCIKTSQCHVKNSFAWTVRSLMIPNSSISMAFAMSIRFSAQISNATYDKYERNFTPKLLVYYLLSLRKWLSRLFHCFHYSDLIWTKCTFNLSSLRYHQRYTIALRQQPERQLCRALQQWTAFSTNASAFIWHDE